MTDVYFSIDIEADGPYPGGFSMSSFGAVACGTLNADKVTTVVDIEDKANQFYTELKPISENFDEKMASVANLDRQELILNGEDPKVAMARFTDWVLETTERITPGGRPVFVGWPLTFDWFWLYWYLMKFNEFSPFGFSGAIDMKSWYASKAKVPLRKVGKRKVYKELGKKARPHTHNGLDDALEQAELWQALLVWEGPTV